LGRLLVVDDEAELLAGLCERLAKQGYEATGFSSARQALEALAQQEYDLLLTDVMMPEMDGLALLRAALQANPHIACVMMTGHGTIQTAVEALKLGALDYVLKPFKMQVLLPVVARALEIRRLRLDNLHLRETVAIHELWQAISYTLDLNTLLNRVADAALQQCEGDEASIMLPSPEGDELWIAIARGENRASLVGERVPITCGIAGWVARNREPLVLEGEIRDPRFAPFRPRSDIRAAISLPMQAGGKLIGILNVHSVHRKSFALGQVKALSFLASAGAAALESAWLYADLKREEGKYHAVFDSVADGIFRITPAGRITLANPALARILGYAAPAELIDSVTDIGLELCTAPEQWRTFCQQMEEDAGWHSAELSLRRKDGSTCWVSMNAKAARDDRKVLYYEGTAEDITARRQAERRQAVQLAVARILAEARNLTDAAPKILEAVCANLHYWSVALWSVDASASRLFCNGFWHRNGGEPSRFEKAAGEVTFAPGDGLPGKVWQSGESAWTADLRTEHSSLRTGLAEQAGLQSAFAFPIKFGRVVLGVIECFADHSQPPDDQTRQMFASVGAQIGQFVGQRSVQEKWDRFFSLSLDVLFIAGFDRYFKLLNPAVQTILGWTIDELTALPYTEFIHPEDVNATLHEMQKLTGQECITCCFENRYRCKDGKYRWLSWRAIPDPHQQLIYAIGRDITEKRLLEEQFRQAQKMDAFGQLAGGIAHDFNNVLTAVNCFSEMLLNRRVPSERHDEYLREIRKAGERATALTRQLLAFSRKQIIQPVPLDLNGLVTELQMLLRRLIGEDIHLTTDLDSALSQVKGDPGQIEQVVMNLVVNARDAMPAGGQVTIQTRNVEFDQEYCQTHPGLAPGQHVMLAVSDTGSGMDATVKAKIFEPFFTTKGVGKGTGLGLAVVHGIVQQSGGSIEVDSALGQGTKFKIYLPRLEYPVALARPVFWSSQMPGGTETILLVDDEETLRKTARLTLESAGYTVLAAKNGDEALDLCTNHPGMIHLLLTDVVMPKISGRQLADVIRALRENIKVLLMSGYTDDTVVRHGVAEAGIAFLQKPLTPIALARKVRDVLDG
jgi:PAS domain S-box-containing protein